MKYFKTSIFPLAAWMMGVALWLSPLSVYASGDDMSISNPVISITVPSKSSADRQALKTLIDDVNEHLSAEHLFTSRTDDELKPSSHDDQYEFFMDYTEDAGDSGRAEDEKRNDTGFVVVSFQVNMRQYHKYSEETRQKIMNIALTDVSNSDLSQSNKNKVYNDIVKLDEPITALVRQLSDDVEADYVGAYAWFRKIAPLVRILFGCFVLATFIGLGISAVLDIAYINIPTVQLFWPKSKKDDSPLGISKEAVSAVKMQAEHVGQEYTNVNFIYLKSRAVNYIIISLCILYLTSGKIFELVATIVNYFRGFLG